MIASTMRGDTDHHGDGRELESDEQPIQHHTGVHVLGDDVPAQLVIRYQESGKHPDEDEYQCAGRPPAGMAKRNGLHLFGRWNVRNRPE